MAKNRAPSQPAKPSNKKRKATTSGSGSNANPTKRVKASAKPDPSEDSKSLSDGPKKPVKKTKLRDQKFIPVPSSTFLGKGKNPLIEDDQGDEELSDDDFDGQGQNDEEAGMEYLLNGGASFLSGLDTKALSRSKKETVRIHQLEKEKAPLPDKKKKNKKDEVPDFDSEAEWDSELDELSDEIDDDEDLEDDEEAAIGSDVEIEKKGNWEDEDNLRAGYSDEDGSIGEMDSVTDEDNSGEGDFEDSESEAEEAPERRRRQAKKDETDLEGDYEAQARVRTAAREALAELEAEEGQQVSHLPIKLANGEIQMMPGKTRIPIQTDGKKKPVPKAEAEETDLSGSEAEEDEEERVAHMAQTKGRFGRLGIVDVLTMDMNGLKGKQKTQERLTIAKEQIAKVGAEVMSGGELIDMVSASHLFVRNPLLTPNLSLQTQLPLLTRLSTFALVKVRTPDNEGPPILVPSSIRGLAFLSQLAVYKDLIPGYRIRDLTALEQAERVKDEVRRLREGERGLVNSYKVYLKTLEAEIKHRSPLASLALKCMTELLVSAPHFNFAENIMGIVVARLSKRSWDADSEMCLQAIITVFRHDIAANVSFTLLRLIARMIKERHFKVHPNVMACLLHLRLRSELSVDDGERKKKGKGKGKWQGRGRPGDKDKDKERPAVKSEIRKQWMTKNMKKAQKEKKEVEREMEDAEAEVDVEDRSKVQTETLKNLFVLYFSILKQPKRGPLLPAAMEGIAKFAHLVNIEFFRDLLAVLRVIIKGDQELDEDEEEQGPDVISLGADVRLKMLCIVTAFELLSGQGEALNIDLNDFIVHLYILLLRLSLDTSIEELPLTRTKKLPKAAVPNKSGQIKLKDVQLASTSDLLFRCLHLIFFSRHASTANSPPWRAAAFAKRLLECSLHFPAATALKSIQFVGQLVTKEEKLEALLSTEDRTADGIYRPDLDDPQLCNAFATNFWELGLLEAQHVDENVREAAHRLANNQSANVN